MQVAEREVELSAAEITIWGILAPVMIAAIAAAVAIAKLLRPKQNGNGKSKTSEKITNVEKALSELDPKAGADAATIKELQGQILVIKAEDTERVKAKTLELSQTIVTLQTQLKTAEGVIGEIKGDLEDLIITTGRDRAQILALDKNVAIMNALTEYDKKRKNRNSNGGPPFSGN